MEQNDDDNMHPNHLDRKSADGSRLSLEALYKIAPSCFTEARDAHTGELRHKIDFDALRQLLGDSVAGDADEMYQFTWPGKREARREAARATDKTLRPVPEESADWDTTQNLYIEGDNLEALKLLQRSYMGKVKMIYIDPPYNTGNDFVYRDDFHQTAADYEAAKGNVDEQGLRYRRNTDSNGRFHSDWCSMIYARLLVARTLLTEDGVIFISIDDNEVENLKKICNEVFGEQNFVGNIIWQSRTSISNDDEISTNHNHTLVFSKQRDMLTFGGDDIAKEEYSNPDNDPRGPWKLVPIDANHVGGDTNYPIRNPKTGADYYPPTGRIWCYNKKTMDELMSDGRIKFGLTDDSSPKRKLFYNERLAKGDSKTPSSILLDAGSTKSGTVEIMDLFDGLKIFDYPKPTTLISRLMQYGFVGSGDIVLDFFSGSATTAHACMAYNRTKQLKVKYILVQLPEDLDKTLSTASTDAKKTTKVAIDFLDRNNKPHNICEIGKERIRRAGAKLKAEMQKEKSKGGDLFDTKTQQLTTNNSTTNNRATNNSTLDTGFRVLRLSESNFTDVSKSPAEYDQQTLDLFADNIRADRTDLDLLFGCMTAWGIDLSLPMAATEVDGRTIYTVDEADSRIGTDQSGLVACFAPDVTLPVVRAIAAKRPQRIVFRDSCFREDKQKINIFEQFKQLLDWSDEEARNNIRVI